MFIHLILLYGACEYLYPKKLYGSITYVLIYLNVLIFISLTPLHE